VPALIGGTLIAAQTARLGNGGSAGDSADFATDCLPFRHRPASFPALNLAACGSLLTANANDYGVEEMFARSVRAFGKPGTCS